jgi:hypothetical protein
VDPDQASGSGSKGDKNDHTKIKKYRIFRFLSAGCSLLRAEGFSVAWAFFREA